MCKVLASRCVNLLKNFLQRLCTDMPRTPWPKVAKILEERYVDGTKCKLCGEGLEGENRVKTLLAIYRHFKEKHPEKLDEIKVEIS